MGDAGERQQVVLAQRAHGDVADQHQLVVPRSVVERRQVEVGRRRAARRRRRRGGAASRPCRAWIDRQPERGEHRGRGLAGGVEVDVGRGVGDAQPVGPGRAAAVGTGRAAGRARWSRGLRGWADLLNENRVDVSGAVGPGQEEGTRGRDRRGGGAGGPGAPPALRRGRRGDRAGRARGGGARWRPCRCTRRASTSTSSWTPGCSTSATRGSPAGAGRGPGGRPSSTGGRRPRSRCRCPGAATTWSGGVLAAALERTLAGGDVAEVPARRGAGPRARDRHGVRRRGATSSTARRGVLGARGLRAAPRRRRGLPAQLPLRRARHASTRRWSAGSTSTSSTGVLDGLGCASARARLQPDPDHCCVRVGPA